MIIKMSLKIDDLSKYKHIHLIGIGGVSMSAIAETLNNWNFLVKILINFTTNYY